MLGFSFHLMQRKPKFAYLLSIGNIAFSDNFNKLPCFIFQPPPFATTVLFSSVVNS